MNKKLKLNAYEKPREYVQEKNKDKVKIFLITAILILLAAAIGLLGAMIYYSRASIDYKQELDNVYKKSFYDVAADMENIEVKLSKMMVSDNDEMKADLADNIWRQSGAVASNLAAMPLEHDVTAKTLKFVNQLGEYSYNLAKKYSSGKKATKADEDSIESLYEKSREINMELMAMTEEIITNRLDFTSRRNRRSTNEATVRMSDGLKNTEIMGTEYPQLIYDGPFSDSIASVDYRMLKDKRAYTADEAVEWVKTHIDGSKNIKHIGFMDGDYRAHQLRAEYGGGECYIQLSENGLVPMLIDCGRTVKEAKLSKDEAVESARLQAERIIGEDSFEGVWYAKTGNIAYVNLAPVIDDIVYYTDIVMVKIALDNGSLLGLESNAYVINHDRELIREVGVTEDYALARIAKKIEVTGIRLAVIPLENNVHVLTYEINGYYKDINYLFYINAETGEETKILRVIDSNQGAILE